MDAGVAGVVAMRYNVYVGTAARFAADMYAGAPGRPAAGRRGDRRPQAARREPGGRYRRPGKGLDGPGGLRSRPAAPDRKRPAAHAASGNASSSGRAMRGGGLPSPPDLGFFGRDETLLALDRAFGSQPVVLLQGEAGSGKTAVAAEFGRWYQRTGGVQVRSCIPPSAGTPPWPAWPPS